MTRLIFRGETCKISVRRVQEISRNQAIEHNNSIIKHKIEQLQRELI